MSETVYTDQMNSVARRRKEIKDQLNRPEEDKLSKLKNIDLQAFTEPFTQFLTNMSYEDKLFTVRKIVDKVIATKEQITICGNIPAYANSMSFQKVGLNAKHSQLQDTTQPNMEGHVKLDAKHWHSRVAECWQKHAF